MRVYHNFFLVPGSRSMFSDADPDPNPAKWYGSNRIRIRNTDLKDEEPSIVSTTSPSCAWLLYLLKDEQPSLRAKLLFFLKNKELCIVSAILPDWLLISWNVRNQI